MATQLTPEQTLRNAVKEAAQAYWQHKQSQPKSPMSYIPASGKVVDDAELCNMIDASLDMWLTAGRFNDEFEKRFAEYLGVRYALTVNSGSSANLVAFSALTSKKLGDRRLQKGDEVISVAAGFPTTVNPIIQHGLVPVFLDCEIGTYNIDVSQIEASLTPKTKAIFLAHTLGNTFDLEAVVALCEKHNLWLIEDSCDALGAEYNGKKVGTFGHMATYSFYPAHHMTMGEGGAVVTNDAKLNKILMSFRDWGRDCWCPPGKDNTCNNRFCMPDLGKLPMGYDHKYTYSHIGFNLKITDWQASIALAQLDKLEGFIAQRKANAAYLLNALADLQEFLILPTIDEKVNPSWFGFILSVKPEAPFTKNELVQYLESQGIGTRQLFAGNLLRQPMMTDYEVPIRILNSEVLTSSQLTEAHYALLPNTDFIMNHTFWIGVYPGLGEAELARTVATIRSYITQKTATASAC
ncbi:MAG: lipopolysaccharide biosynthesis protein RfbH [Vampirovibrionales bacterium]